ncbi:protein kinase domain containing protein [Entamoeba histolytica HM-1:IMSS-B]|uniref:Protein kinase domain containing protein n=5 Tax=Entamoeba histolytica TaxID=5759 RepID=C4M9L7_ENTH1|nr:protein kinase domain containing protein [Entamoeba histolytica HM-1:IMSS]EMH77865.1 protein kinase domain containing protein [Entamoeba histolytica HM-1:IMSS-B]EMS12548.1 protein kinase domain containing protein [Entamoeba histolytica HM-3:IMSS]ENY65953.1 protein kinase domain containing protein [Entamoeba histolytica HM-1:IMSS-A]GAT98374.1 protein kinase domain containing protein [Entamoeba histolytica]EAL44480.1 protein kinase domain containing protein [Entamoeba histolytica HM-1:IMSS]|eukprot:XP_649865.1 protein kinase domain containing protein [Entamoeba histolytica HM-1:IMSS]
MNMSSIFVRFIQLTKDLLTFEADQPISKQQYIILERISSNNIIKYYRCKHRNGLQQVCVKICRREKRYRYDGQEEILHEINTLRRLKNQNIIHIQQYFIGKSYAGYEMELMEGGNLQQWIEVHQYIPIELFCIVSTQLLKALHYIHSNEIVHRDITLHSILLTTPNNFNSLKLTHFEQSFNVNEPIVDEHITIDFHYAAPELFRHYLYTFSADVWSLGILLFKCFTSQYPFESTGKEELVKAILRGKVEFPLSLPSLFIKMERSLLNPNVDNRLSPKETLKILFQSQD